MYMKYGGLVGNVIMGVYLISLSYSDMKRRKLSVGVIVLGFLSALVFQAITGIESWRAVAGGILTGFLFMGISRLTEEKIGYGDSLLIIVLGTFLGMWKLLILLLGAFGLAAAVSILLMIKRKFTRKSMIPFVPFLTVAYMGEMLGVEESESMGYVSGSTVVEMSYIMPLILLMFVLIIHTVFYFYDRAVLNGAAAETAVLGAELERRHGAEEENLKEFFEERTSGKLILMTNPSVAITRTDNKIHVTAMVQKGRFELEVRQRAVIVNPEEKIRWIK